MSESATSAANGEAMPQRIRDEVDALFAGVRYWPRGLFFSSKSHKQFMLDLRKYTRPGGRCLDLGCGSGRYKPFIEAHGLEWYGADVMDPEQPQPNYRKVADNRIGFDDEFFDVVCTFNVIEHFTHPLQMFAEIRRVLTPGGVFCGACAFWEREHESFFHLSHLGLSELLKQFGFELVSLVPSEYSGLVLVAQRFLGGDGRISHVSKRARLSSTLLCNLNWIPFTMINALEFLRRTLARGSSHPLKDCATLYFYARKTTTALARDAYDRAKGSA